MGVNTQYAKEIYEQFRYLATWLPSANVRLGDVGIVIDGVFEKVGTLADFGVHHSLQVDPNLGELEYTSSDAITVQFKADGSGPAPGVAMGKVDGNIEISFSRPNAILFQASDCRMSSIANLKEVNDAILSKYLAGMWQKQHVVISNVMNCEAATILISNGANAHISLKAKGIVGAEKLKLADANAQLEVTNYSAIGTRIVGQRGSTPLFQARGIKTSFLPWRGASVGLKDSSAQVESLNYLDLIDPTERGG